MLTDLHPTWQVSNLENIKVCG